MFTTTNLRPFLCWDHNLRPQIIEAITSPGAAERFADDGYTGAVHVTPATGDEHHRALFSGGTVLLGLDSVAFTIVDGRLAIPGIEDDETVMHSILDDETGRPLPRDEFSGMLRASLA